MKPPINGKTGLLCLVGNPVGHSGSPSMYNFCFDYHDLDLSYMAFQIDESQMEDFVRSARLLNIRGFNATMPCKHEAARLSDEQSPQVRIIGAANTVVNKDGRLYAHMTDGAGFVMNLRDKGVEVAGKRIVLVGAGGAATAIFVECVLSGAASVTVYNRSAKGVAHIESVIERVRANIDTPVCEMRALTIGDGRAMYEEIKTSDILINGTSVGMSPDDDSTIIQETSCLHSDLVVADIVYNPLETRLLREARAAGVRLCIPGDGMLLWQAAVAYKLYTGLDMPVDEYKAFKEKGC